MKPKIKIRVTVSDPWEFYEDNEDSGTFFADLIDCQDNCILFYSHKPIILRSMTGKKQWRSFFGTPRFAENLTDKITTENGCPCNIMAVTDAAITLSEAIRQTRAWRGGNAMIASVYLSQGDALG